jgi:hypothetical protein
MIQGTERWLQWLGTEASPSWVALDQLKFSIRSCPFFKISLYNTLHSKHFLGICYNLDDVSDCVSDSVKILGESGAMDLNGLEL